MKILVILFLITMIYSFDLKEKNNQFIGTWELNCLIVNQDTFYLRGNPSYSYNHVRNNKFSSEEEKIETTETAYLMMSKWSMEFDNRKMTSHSDILPQKELRKNTFWSKYNINQDTLIIDQNQKNEVRKVNFTFLNSNRTLVLKEEYVKSIWNKIK